MPGYYADKLAADRLRRCYELAPPPTRAYLRAEIDFVRERCRATMSLLELGCGYGRVLLGLRGAARWMVGIDTSPASLALGCEARDTADRIDLLAMDATRLGFAAQCFDLVVCIQNGISAFGVDRTALVREAIRVTRPGGRALFSSYAAGFWEDRLEWFRIQADHGLIGEIDWTATGGGVIVCTDGFRATTVGREEFRALARALGVAAEITEVAGSSLFCEFQAS